MKYPRKLKVGDKVGICAPSMGVTGVYLKRLEKAKEYLENLGYECIETESVRNVYKLASEKKEIRAKEFMELYLNDDINLIIPPWGGEFLMEILPHLDFEAIKKARPKWILGFSDISTLLYAITLKSDIATVHGPNLMDFGAELIDDSVKNVINILSDGEEFTQHSFDFYQKEYYDINKNPYIPFNLTEKVQWKCLANMDTHKFEGRLIGGCLDTISNLIGTKYSDVNEFINNYSEDGLIWYLESCDMDISVIYRTLWQMKMNGYFKNCKGILYGRSEGLGEYVDVDLEDSLRNTLGDLNIPIIYDVDIGHLPPQLTLLNGAYAKVIYEEGKGTIVQSLI